MEAPNHSNVSRVVTDAAKHIAQLTNSVNANKRKQSDLMELVSRHKAWMDAEDKRLLEACGTNMQASVICRYASGVFNDAAHLKQCKAASDLVREIGGVDKLKEITEKYKDFKERKLDIDQLEYEDVIGKLCMSLGSLVRMTWMDASCSVVRVIKQQANATKPSDISFEVIYRPHNRNAMSFITLPYTVVSDYAELLSAKNANNVFNAVTDEANLAILYDARDKRGCKISFKQFSKNVIQQTRNAVEQQLGLSGCIKERPAGGASSSSSPLHQLASAASHLLESDDDADEVQVVGYQTMEERNRIGFLNAICIE